MGKLICRRNCLNYFDAVDISDRNIIRHVEEGTTRKMNRTSKETIFYELLFYFPIFFFDYSKETFKTKFYKNPIKEIKQWQKPTKEFKHSPSLDYGRRPRIFLKLAKI